MKTILITIALIGFTAVGSYAQNTKTCSCKKKVVRHAAATHHKAAPAVAMTKKHVAHKKVAVTCPVVVNYQSDRSYTGNYPKTDVPRESNYMVYPLRSVNADIPTTDPDYYLKLDDGRCRWHCTPGLDQFEKEKK